MPYPNIQINSAIGYNNFQRFRSDVEALSKYYMQGLVPRRLSQESNLAYDVFKAHYSGNIANAWGMLVNTMDNPLQTVLLGRVSMQFPVKNPREIASLDELVGISLKDSTLEIPLLDEGMHRNFGIATEFLSGSISWSNNWTLLMNDALILGGIQKNLPFYLVSKRTAENIWDSRNGRLTVTGRELVAIMTSGYKMRRLPDGSEYMHNDADSPRGISLPEYNKAVDFFTKSPERWRYLTEPELFSMTFDFDSNVLTHIVIGD